MTTSKLFIKGLSPDVFKRHNKLDVEREGFNQYSGCGEPRMGKI